MQRIVGKRIHREGTMTRVLYAALAYFFALALLLSGCGEEQTYEQAIQEASDDFTAVVYKSVEDPERAARIVEFFDRNREYYGELFAISRKYHAQFRQLNADYDATREQFEQFYGEYDESWIVVRNRILENMFEIKEHTTEDEWQDLVKQFRKYVNQRIAVEYAME
jgi:hypothetical protein